MECALNKPQIEILKSARLKTKERSIEDEILSNITAEIRAEIAASDLNFLDANHSKIPPELKECALRLAVERLILRMPNMEISALQEKHADIARQTLRRIALSELPISRPANGVRTGDSKKSANVLHKRERKINSENLGGL